MRSLRPVVIRTLLLAASSFACPLLAGAQTFPENKPVVLVVPFSAGGGTDAVARDIGRVLGEKLGQPVVIENKGGGGGMIGAQHVAKARPDGHTLLLTTSSLLTASAGQRKLPFDVLKDFTPISLFARGPLMVIVNNDAGITSITDLIAKAKAMPDALNFASSGIGSVLHLSGELLAQRAGVKITHVPYQGAGPATIDLLAGHVQVFVMTPPSVIGHIKAKSLKVIATTGRTRMKIFPDVPTVQEGGVAGYDVGTWWGITGPAGMPPSVVAAIDKAVRDALTADVVRKRFEDEGAEIVTSSQAEFAQLLRSDLDMWRQVVKDGNLKYE